MRMKHIPTYQETIRGILDRKGISGIEPAHVEAFMRVYVGTLDGLDRRRFARLVMDAVEEIRGCDPDVVASVAKSYGL
jgi:hypothetical protein